MDTVLHGSLGNPLGVTVHPDYMRKFLSMSLYRLYPVFLVCWSRAALAKSRGQSRLWDWAVPESNGGERARTLGKSGEGSESTRISVLNFCAVCIEHRLFRPHRSSTVSHQANPPW
jgi:hypothetical protein